MEIITNIIHGNCEEKLKSLDEDSIDLIITSPPYADQRKNSYPGKRPNRFRDSWERLLQFNKT